MMTATAAAAADVAGWYAGIYAGTSVRSDASITTAVGGGGFNFKSTREHPEFVVTSTTNPVDPAMLAFANLFLSRMPYASTGAVDGEFHDGRMSFDPAFALDVAVGFRLGNGWRLETSLAGAEFNASTVSLEPGFSDFTLGSYTTDNTWLWVNLPLGLRNDEPGRTGAAGDIMGVISYSTRADFLLASAWYDFETNTAITPYAGGGIGVARLSGEASFDCRCDGPVDVVSTGTRIVPAAQLGGGVEIALADPVSLDIGYRYRVAADAGLGFDYVGSDGALPRLTSIRQSGLVGVHALSAGLTFAFN